MPTILRHVAAALGLALLVAVSPLRAEPALDWLTTVDEAAGKIQGVRADRARTIPGSPPSTR